ncbi:hypothetical protein MRB53_041694 [Persea americana]|nr:hypothetical protein MRB53_041694 [Persea americana]
MHMTRRFWSRYVGYIRTDRQNAQMLKLDEEPKSDLDAIEVEIRRRLWWTICSLESRGAEGGMKKKDPLLAHIKVQMPLNVNDNDLQAGIKETPQPERASQQ